MPWASARQSVCDPLQVGDQPGVVVPRAFFPFEKLSNALTVLSPAADSCQVSGSPSRSSFQPKDERGVSPSEAATWSSSAVNFQCAPFF
jgi:hypothetical protein